MKIAILSDIHGNNFALQAVLDAASAAGVERLLVGGDLVGYYFEPLKVWNMLQQWDYVAVRGNHEAMLEKAYFDRKYLESIDLRYGTGLRVALEQFTKQQLETLWQLPETLSLNVGSSRILLCHGSPWDTDQYIYPDSPTAILQRCAISDYDIVILGHTHYPMQIKLNNTLVINPGSVGQSRNFVKGAHWILLDTDTNLVDLRVEQYDIQIVVDECRRRHPNLPYLSDVLLRK